MKTYQRSVLPSGLRVITSPLNTESLTVLILVGAGSRYEDKDINGISHFLEHMFFKGAKKYKNAREVSETVDSVGGLFNAFTGKEYAGYFIKVAAEHLDTALDVLSDMMLHATFQQDEIDRERNVILEEYNMYQDTPMYQIGWEFEKLVFGDQPIGWDEIGTKEFIRNVTQEQFRTYKHSLYTPDNMVVAITGKVDHDDIASKVGKALHFSNETRTRNWKPFEASESTDRFHLQNKVTEQGHIVIGFPSYSFLHKDYYPMKLLAIMLGGNMSSRMFMNIREQKGLCYYVHTTTDDYSDCGIISTRAGVDLTRTEFAVEAVIQEYKNIFREPPTEKELQKAKQYIKGKLILSLEDTEEVAHLLTKRELLHEGIKTLDEICAEVEKITLGDIQRVAEDIFRPDRLYMAMIGPFEDRRKNFENLLGF